MVQHSSHILASACCSHVIGRFEVLTHKVSLRKLIGNVNSQLTFLDLLAALLRALNVNILTVTCLHIKVSTKLLQLSSPLTATIFYRAVNTES